jgi:hypothetical protein
MFSRENENKKIVKNNIGILLFGQNFIFSQVMEVQKENLSLS